MRRRGGGGGGEAHSILRLLDTVEFALSTLHLSDTKFEKLDPESVGAERAQVGCRHKGGGAGQLQ